MRRFFGFEAFLKIFRGRGKSGSLPSPKLQLALRIAAFIDHHHFAQHHRCLRMAFHHGHGKFNKVQIAFVVRRGPMKVFAAGHVHQFHHRLQHAQILRIASDSHVRNA
jgi:hypothetical protein